MNNKSKYISSAFLLLLSSVIVKIIGAFYKIPLTSSIGAVGRGYFSTAYNLYMPLHVIIMGAFPIALSRLISKYNALDNKLMLSSLKKASRSLFFIIGVAGTGIILIFAKPYSVFIAGAPKSVYTIFVLAPSLLFACASSAYRGYYEGFMDMKPTAVSQILEAVFKLVFGILLARASMRYFYDYYTVNGSVLGTYPKNSDEALSLIYPLTSAAAMLGVTLGTLISLAYLVVYDRINSKGSIKVSSLQGRRELLSFSLPIIISCSVQSVFQFLDTASVQYSLNRLSDNVLRASLPTVVIPDSDLSSYAYGIFSTALDFKNIIPGITMALGVCAVPALCREYEAGNKERLETLMNSVFKYTSLLACYGSIFLALFSKNILTLFYSSSPDIISGCEGLVKYFAFTVPVYCLASTAVFSVQALGKPEKSIPSYIVAGTVRIVLNVALINNERLVMYGAVISGAVGYFLLFVINFSISKRLSGVRLSIFTILLKPLFIAVSEYFAVFYLSNYINFFKNNLINLLIELVVFSTIYYILCILLKALNLKEIFCAFNFKKNGLNA